MPAKKDKKIIVAVLVTALTVLILSWLVIYLLGNKVRQSFENYQKEKLNSLVLEEKRNKILQLERELPGLKEERNSLDSMLIKKDAAVSFLRALEEAAANASCQIKVEPADISKIKFEKKAAGATKKPETDDLDTAQKDDQEKVPGEKNKKEDELASLKDYPAFSVEITGRFASIVDFFEKFENMPYFIRPLVVDISSGERNSSTAVSAGALSAGNQISPENENSDEKNIKMKMTFVIYGS